MQSPQRAGRRGAPREASELKAYARPVLTEYGRIAELTRAVDFKGNADGGTVVFMRKT